MSLLSNNNILNTITVIKDLAVAQVKKNGKIISMTNLTSETFEELITKSELPVIVDFWATWCQPCKMITPILMDMAEKFKGQVNIVKCNVDEQPQLAGEYAIRSVPTMMFFYKGDVIHQTVGFSGRNALEAEINYAIKESER